MMKLRMVFGYLQVLSLFLQCRVVLGFLRQVYGFVYYVSLYNRLCSFLKTFICCLEYVFNHSTVFYENRIISWNMYKFFLMKHQNLILTSILIRYRVKCSTCSRYLVVTINSKSGKEKNLKCLARKI